MNSHAAKSRALAALLVTASMMPMTAAHAQTAAQSAAQPDAEEPTQEILVTGRSMLDLKVATHTGSRLNLTPLETPASVYAVDGDAIRARGDLSINDAVTRAPGITSVASIGDGGTGLASRGFSGQGSVLQLVDGVRQFPVQGTITFPSDPWNVDRIEVLTGPASVLYGQGALGGAINVITKKPSEQRSLNMEASYGSQDTVHLAAGAGGAIAQGWSYRLDGSYRRSDGYVDRGENHSLALSGALRFAPTDDFSLTLQVDYAAVHPMEYTGTPLIDGKIDKRTRHRNYNVGDADIDYKDDRQTLTLQWAPSETLTIMNTAYRIGSKRSWYDLEYYCYVQASGSCSNGYVTGTPGKIARSGNYGIRQDIEQYGNQGSATLTTPLGGSMTNALVVGFDVNSIDVKYANNFDYSDQADEVDPYNFDPGVMQNRAETVLDWRAKTLEWSVFAEDRLKFNDQLSIVGGFRYEEDRLRRRNYDYTDGVITGTSNAFDVRQKTFRNFTWRVGAVYQPTPDVSVYGQYSTGVDPIGSLASTSASQIAYSNAKGDQVEVGVKASFLGGRGSATLSAYRIVKKDLLVQRTTDSPIEQVGQRSSKGIEAAVSLALAAGFGIEANGTVLDAKYDDYVSGGADYTGNTPYNVPKEAANLWLTWQGLEKVRAQVGLRYVGKRYADDANTSRIPAYTVVDAGLSYAFTENLAVDLRVYNVFDKVYAISAYDYDQWVLGRPQSFDVAVRARF
ncbi:tonB-dependent siderophore receptor family protein [Novosphingobium sp. Rr 2-17]|nr:tonB-dependent siderophore receptor family protein [Novosphingobium sp. Rr 2-17]